MTSTFDAKGRRVTGQVILWIGILTCLLIFTAIGIYYQRSRQPWEGFKAPDDVQIARDVLAEKFTGPRYFQVTETADNLPHPYISIFDARQQIEGIIKARQLPPGAVEKLERLIDILAEPSTSHLVGVSRVNTLQLNLALDAAK